MHRYVEVVSFQLLVFIYCSDLCFLADVCVHVCLMYSGSHHFQYILIAKFDFLLFSDFYFLAFSLLFC